MDNGPGSIVLELERKLSKKRFLHRNSKDKYCRVSINYYWDLLKYIDDDYLTEWEILKFKDLYVNQLGNMCFQTLTMIGLGYMASHIICWPALKQPTSGFLYRLPVFSIMAYFFIIQSGHWQRPNEIFHEIM